ncbi:restriction endonuclease subunit S [Pseudomonas frederiksbergensis]
MTDLRQNLETDGIWIDEKAYRYLEKSSLVGGELLMASVGSVGLIYLMPHVDYKASLAPNMYLLKTNNSLQSKFLYWVLLSKGGQGQILQVATTTAQPKLNKDNVRSIVVAFPNIREQIQIARFLDHETARIDALIEEQLRLIELLKEKRQAVISLAVTKGLDSTVPMKDSGVEWLGEVPVHWSISPLKFLVDEKVAGPYGASLTKAMYTNSGYRVYGQQQVISDDFSIGDYYISEEKFNEMQRYTVFPGDVLVSVMGTIGRVSVVPAEVEVGIINPRLVRYKFCQSKITPEFVKILLMSLRYQSRLREESQGSTMEGLNMVILGDLPLVLPPQGVQHTVVNFVKNYDCDFNALVDQATSAAELLKERRSALIFAAVTGKIDVRGWQLPASAQARELTQEAV